MTPDTIKAISDALAPIASKIGTGGIYIFNLAVRQAYITGIEEALVTVAILSIYIPFMFFAWKKLTVKEERCYGESEPAWDESGWVSVGLLSLLVIGTTICLLTDGVNAIANPQYYALQSLLSQIVTR